MLNPMCCISPRIGAFIFAILDLIICVPFAYNSIKTLVDSKFDVTYLLDCILYVVLVILALLLLFGAIQKNADNIRTWLMVWIVFIILWVILAIFQISTTSTAVDNFKGAGLGITLLFIYQIWVVYAYLIELREGPNGLTYCPAQVV